MALFTEVWSRSFSSGIIATTASEIFGNDSTTIQLRQKYGSANVLILSNISDEDFLIKLDALASRTKGILYKSGGSYVLEAEEGTFFDYVELENISATNSAADEVKITISRRERIAA